MNQSQLDRIEARLEKIEELHRVVHDLLIQVITIQQVPVLLTNTNSTSSSSASSSSAVQKFKADVSSVPKEFKEDMGEEEVEGFFYREWSSATYTALQEKLNENSGNNKVNVFKWLYSHVNQKRKEALTRLGVSEKMQEWGEKKEKERAKCKDIHEWFRMEANEIHRQCKDEEEFKKLISEFKKQYDKVLQSSV